jgi:dehydrogenase/reductase SDR family protein 13
MPEYNVSKLANVLFVQELARRVPADELFVVALHPGNLIGTDVTRRLPGPLHALMKRIRPSPEVGARTSIMCATEMDVLDHRGAYYSVGKLKEPNRAATPELAAELWERSEEWTAPDFDVDRRRS